MAKELVQKNIFQTMALKYQLNSQEFLKTIKATVIRPGKDGRIASDEEVAAFLVVAAKYNLDPFTNEIYAFPAKKGGIIPVVGLDGFVSQMNKSKDFDGMEILYSEDEKTMEGGKGCPEWCEVKIYRKSLARPIVVREYLDEVYVPVSEKGFRGPWQTHTKRMLRHKTIIQGARIGFGITGIYDPDEADRVLEAETEELVGKPDVNIPKELTSSTENQRIDESTSAGAKEENLLNHILDESDKKKISIARVLKMAKEINPGIKLLANLSKEEQQKLLDKIKETNE